MTTGTFHYTNINGRESLVVFIEGAGQIVAPSHANFTKIRDLLFRDQDDTDYDEVNRLASAKALLDSVARLSDRVTLKGESILLDGDPVEPKLTSHLVEMWRNEDDNLPGYVKFLENLAANPSAVSREHLFKFLDKHELVITEDGHFIGYKGIGNDGLSVSSGVEDVTVVLADGTVETHKGRIPNPVGATVEMARSLVDGDRGRACSAGLHVGNHRYATGFGSTLLTVKVNPRDVVSVPSDSNDEKIRTCRYTILEVNEGRTLYGGTSYITESSDESDFDDEGCDDDDCCGDCGDNGGNCFCW